MTKLFAILLALFAAQAIAAPVTVQDCASKRCPQAVFSSRLPQIEGTLAVLHADDFAGKSSYLFQIHEDNGVKTTLNLPALPQELRPGQRVVVQGTRTAAVAKAGVVVAPSITPSRIIIVPPTAKAGPRMLKSTSNSVLVILVNYSAPDSSISKLQAQDTMNKVAAYFDAASYGQQSLAVTITDVVKIAGAPDCDWSGVGTKANAAAKAANPAWDSASYAFTVYLWPSQGCGWKGLAYVGYPRLAWIAGSGSFVTSVVAHEMGHNFGLLHAGSLSCGGGKLGTANPSCGVAEYGDGGSLMGSGGEQYNAEQKRVLGWIPVSSVVTHTTGTASYDVDMLEQKFGKLYAVSIPTGNPNRTYIVESRAASPNAARVLLTRPFEFVSGMDDTETVAVLADGQTYRDDVYAINITVGKGGPAIPPPPPPGVSPDGTTVPPAAAITVAAGDVFTLGTDRSQGGFRILKNGKAAGGGFAARLLAKGGSVYALNDAGTWFAWNEAAGKWSQLPTAP